MSANNEIETLLKLINGAKTSEIELMILAGLKTLRDRALKNEPQPAQSLFVMAWEAASFVRQVAKENPDLVAPAARKSAFFPVLIAPNNSQDEINSKLLADCEAGKESSLKATGQRAMKFNSQASVTAGNLYQEIQAIRRGIKRSQSLELDAKCKALPDPSKATFSQWESVMEMLLPRQIDCYPNDLWPEVFSQKDRPDGWKVDEIIKRILQAFSHLIHD